MEFQFWFWELRSVALNFSQTSWEDPTDRKTAGGLAHPERPPWALWTCRGQFETDLSQTWVLSTCLTKFVVVQRWVFLQFNGFFPRSTGSFDPLRFILPRDRQSISSRCISALKPLGFLGRPRGDARHASSRSARYDARYDQCLELQRYHQAI